MSPSKKGNAILNPLLEYITLAKARERRRAEKL
jgi:hypothetical protein